MNRYTREIIGQSKAEGQAIESHLETLGKLHGTIEQFDGKVINIRFFDALTTAAGRSIYKGETYPDLTTFRIRYDDTAKLDGKHHYAQWHRECNVIIQFQECGKRLDALATINNLEEMRSTLLKKAYHFSVTETEINEAHAQLDTLKAQISELIGKHTNHYLTDSLRQSAKYIR